MRLCSSGAVVACVCLHLRRPDLELTTRAVSSSFSYIIIHPLLLLSPLFFFISFEASPTAGLATCCSYRCRRPPRSQGVPLLSRTSPEILRSYPLQAAQARPPLSSSQRLVRVRSEHSLHHVPSAVMHPQLRAVASPQHTSQRSSVSSRRTARIHTRISRSVPSLAQSPARNRATALSGSGCRPVTLSLARSSERDPIPPFVTFPYPHRLPPLVAHTILVSPTTGHACHLPSDRRGIRHQGS